MMTPDEQKIFNDLCNIVIYHYSDLYRKKGNENSRSAKRLVKLGYMDHTADHENAYEQYEKMVVEYALAIFPKGFRKAYDYWGAACISDCDSPKHGHYYAGEVCHKIMFFDNFEALKEYTAEKMTEMAEGD